LGKLQLGLTAENLSWCTRSSVDPMYDWVPLGPIRPQLGMDFFKVVLGLKTVPLPS
jgi:hypothetical protein